MSSTKRKPLPPWIKKQIAFDASFRKTRGVIEEHGVQTICTNARCPNRGECWTRGTATVLILGNICTRSCPFCAVSHGKPEPPDPLEPEHVARMAVQMNILYLVITSVDRDDLPDGGATQFTKVITACRDANPGMRFEILVPDFKNSQQQSLEILESAHPFVFSHNIETVPSLYRKARPGGDYQRSLDILLKASERWPETPIKSSIMLGLGETDAEVIQVLKDLRNSGCTRAAIG
nr:lipoyl synthase [Spirochaetales bacterium]